MSHNRTIRQWVVTSDKSSDTLLLLHRLFRLVGISGLKWPPLHFKSHNEMADAIYLDAT